jgi:phenylacetate-CoA ligase
VGEFRVTIERPGAMAKIVIEIEIECHDGASEADALDEVSARFASALGLQPVVKTVPRGTLPRFELKARRFFVS